MLRFLNLQSSFTDVFSFVTIILRGRQGRYWYPHVIGEEKVQKAWINCTMSWNCQWQMQKLNSGLLSHTCPIHSYSLAPRLHAPAPNICFRSPPFLVQTLDLEHVKFQVRIASCSSDGPCDLHIGHWSSQCLFCPTFPRSGPGRRWGRGGHRF